MFDKLLDWIVSILNDLVPWFVVKEWQEAIVLRLGKFRKVYKKGIHFRIPFVDEIIEQHIIVTTLSLPPQSLITKDDKGIVVAAVVKYKITDIKVFVLEIFDSVDAISDVTQGIIKNVIMSSTWEQCRDLEIDNTITKKVRNEIKKFGVYVEAITLTDIAPIRTIRLINDSIHNG